MMNILIDSLPDYVVVNHKKYEVVTDFREWIRFALLLESELSSEEKFYRMLQWYRNDIPEDITKAVESLGDFFAAREIKETEDTTEAEEKATNNIQAFDFEQDATDIYADFLIHYGIDLQSIEYMHWYKFRVLFESLPPKSSMKMKIYYRTVDLNEIKNRDERNRIREIRQKIKIVPKNKTVVSDYDIGDAFA